MPAHRCLFCPKADGRFPPGALATAVRPLRPQGSTRVAVPVFMGRVAPVLDACTRMGVWEPGRQRKIAFRTIPVKARCLIERVEEIGRLGVGLVICSAVSEVFFRLLKARGIDLICGVTGDIAEVLLAYRQESLRQPRFRMPGCIPPEEERP